MKSPKYVNKNAPNAMRLQSVGWVQGSKASEIKIGDKLMWNFGSVYEVVNILSQTDKTIKISEKCTVTGKEYERKLFKERIVCIL